MDLGFSKSFTKAQQLSGVSLSSFIASISISVLIFGTEIVIFLAVRRRFPQIYPPVQKPFKNALADVNKSIITRCVRFERDHGHFDRYFFRRYVRTLFIIFLPAALLITPILLPINYIHGKTFAFGVSGLDTLGWSNVGLNHSDRYWAHLILGILFVAHVCWVIWSELVSYVAIRQDSPYAALRTVLIDSIPESWMARNELTSQFNIFPGEITTIAINRDFSLLSQLVARREGLVRSLEIAETRYIRKALNAGVKKRCERLDAHRELMRPLRGSWNVLGLSAWFKVEKVDAILSYRKALQEMNEEIRTCRETPQIFPQLPSAFVTFDNPLAAHMACQTVIHSKSGYMTPRTLPISVNDIVWDNVCISWWDRNTRIVVSNLLIVVLAILCVVPAAFTGLLSQVIYLTQAVAWLSWINDLPGWSLGLLQGVLPPTLLAILVKGFSATLEYLVRKQGISSKSMISLKIQDYYFGFLFVQLTLVVSLSAGLTTIANEVANGGSLVATLAKNLPKASNYFVSYVLLQALSVSANSLLRIDRLVGRFLLAPIFDETVTQKIKRETGQDIQWGTFVPVYTNLACIGFLYAIISPIIIPFQVLIFALFWTIYSESAVILTKRDSGGLFYPKALKHLLIGLYLMEMSLTALFLLVRDSQGKAKCVGQACFMILATALTAVYHHILCKAFDPLLVFTPTSSKNFAAKDSVPFSPFRHKALKSTPVIRFPRDDLGISSDEASQTRKELREINVLDNEATISLSGSITVM